MQSPDLLAPPILIGPVVGIGSRFSAAAALAYLQEKHSNSCVISAPLALIVLDNTIENADDFEASFRNCLDRNPEYILFLVFFPSHTNAALYDTRNKELEIFEPYGENSDVDEQIYSEIADLLSSIVGPVKLFRPTDYCPIDPSGRKRGPQYYEQQLPGDPKGFCQAWSLWWLDYRMSNPQLDRETLMTQALQRLSKNSNAIRRYSALLTQARNELLDRLSGWVNKKGLKCQFQDLVVKAWKEIADSEKNPELQREARIIYDRLESLNRSNTMDFKWLINTAFGQWDRFAAYDDQYSQSITEMNDDIMECVYKYLQLYWQEISRPVVKMCDARLDNLTQIKSEDQTLVGKIGDEYNVYVLPISETSQEQLDLLEQYNKLESKTPCMSPVEKAIVCQQVPRLPAGEYHVLFEQISEFNLGNAELNSDSWRSILFQIVWTLFIFGQFGVQLDSLLPETIMLFNGQGRATFVPDPSQSTWFTLALQPLAQISTWAWSTVFEPVLKSEYTCADLDQDCVESAKENLRQLCQSLQSEAGVDKAFLARVIQDPTPEKVLQDPYFQPFRNQPIILQAIYSSSDDIQEWLGSDPQEAEASAEASELESEPEADESAESDEPAEPDEPDEPAKPRTPRAVMSRLESKIEPTRTRFGQSGRSPKPRLVEPGEPRAQLRYYKQPGRTKFQARGQKAECTTRKLYNNRYNIKELRQIAKERKIPRAFHISYDQLCDALGFERN